MHSSSGVTGLVLSYRLFYFLSASWMLAGAAKPVSVVILFILHVRAVTSTSRPPRADHVV